MAVIFEGGDQHFQCPIGLGRIRVYESAFRQVPPIDAVSPMHLAEQRGLAGHQGCLQFLVLTACRSCEVRLSEWHEVDRDSGIWTIPAERSKTGREHKVPLAPRVLAVLDEARRLSHGEGLNARIDSGLDSRDRIPTRAQSRGSRARSLAKA